MIELTILLFLAIVSLVLLVGIGGLAGVFRGDYELFRAVGSLAFVPLLILFVLLRSAYIPLKTKLQPWAAVVEAGLPAPALYSWRPRPPRKG